MSIEELTDNTAPGEWPGRGISFAVCSSVGRAPMYKEAIGSIPIGGTTIHGRVVQK